MMSIDISCVRRLVILIALGLLGLVQPCFGQDLDPDTAIYRRLQGALVRIPEIFAAGANTAVRAGLRDRLADLHEEMYKLETAKRELLRLARSTNGDLGAFAARNPDFAQRLNDVRVLTQECRGRIGNLGSHIRQLGKDAIAQELEISTALGSRKEWLDQITNAGVGKDYILKSGEEAIDALQKADAELLKVMEALQAN